jgi:hypothetical protein
MRSHVFTVNLFGLPIEDAFIYRTQLFAWTFDARILIFEVEDIERAMRQTLNDGTLADAINVGLFHARSVGTTPTQRDSWAAYRRSSNQSDVRVDLEADAIPRSEFAAALEADSLLNLLIYNDTTYVGTDQGLFTVAWPGRTGNETVRLSRRLRYACYHTAASLGSVAASCGEDGLRVLFDELRYMPTKDRPKARLVAPRSVRSAFGAGSLINFLSRAEFDVLRVEKTEVTRDGQTQVVASRIARGDFSLPEDEARSVFDPDFADYLFFVRRRLVSLAGGSVYSAILMSRDNTAHLAKTVHLLGSYTGTPIGAALVQDDVLVETSTGLLAIAGERAISKVIDVPIIALRSYPNSVRYLRMATATHDGGLTLLGLMSID